MKVHVPLEGVLFVFATLGHLPEEVLVVQVPGDGAHLLDVALGGVEVAVAGDGEALARVTVVQDLGDDGEQQALRAPALGDQEGVGPLHLGRAAVEEAALVFHQVQLVHELFDVLAARADQIQRALLGVAPLEHVPHGVQQHVVALVPAVALVAQHEGAPLQVGHGGGAGVGEHVHGEHACGEGDLVVVGAFEGPLPLLHGDLGDVPLHIGEGTGGGYVEGIFHTVSCLQFDLIRDTPVTMAGARALWLADSIGPYKL